MTPEKRIALRFSREIGGWPAGDTTDTGTMILIEELTHAIEKGEIPGLAPGQFWLARAHFYGGHIQVVFCEPPDMKIIQTKPVSRREALMDYLKSITTSDLMIALALIGSWTFTALGFALARLLR